MIDVFKLIPLQDLMPVLAGAQTSGRISFHGTNSLQEFARIAPIGHVGQRDDPRTARNQT